MKMSSGRVIKSHDVQYVTPMENASSMQTGASKELPASAMSETTRRDRLKDTFAEKLQQAVKEAYENGVAEGVKKGRDLQSQDSLRVLQSMNQVIKETAMLKEKILVDVEKQILELSLAIAEKVLHSEVTTNSEVIKNVLRDAIRNIVDRDNMKIRLHPLDFRTMMEIKADFLQSFDGLKNILFEEDDSIQRGGAIIETMFGEVDARLEQQYQEVKAGLKSDDVCE